MTITDQERADRLRKGRKIVAVLTRHLADPARLELLDVGCNVGVISDLLGHSFARVLGVDVSAEAVAAARAGSRRANVAFEVAQETELPVASASFDVAVCNQVYEHARDPEGLMREVHRVLRPGGCCFFGARNRLHPMDGHYPLPLIHLLPRRLADLYMRVGGGKPRYDVNLRTYWGLKRLERGFARHDYTVDVIRDPDTFASRDVVPTALGLNRLLARLAPLPLVYGLIPNYIWMLERRDAPAN